MTIRTDTRVGFDPVQEYAEAEKFRETHQDWFEAQSTVMIAFEHTDYTMLPIGSYDIMDDEDKERWRI